MRPLFLVCFGNVTTLYYTILCNSLYLNLGLYCNVDVKIVNCN